MQIHWICFKNTIIIFSYSTNNGWEYFSYNKTNILTNYNNLYLFKLFDDGSIETSNFRPINLYACF